MRLQRGDLIVDTTMFADDTVAVYRPGDDNDDALNPTDDELRWLMLCAIPAVLNGRGPGPDPRPAPDGPTPGPEPDNPERQEKMDL